LKVHIDARGLRVDADAADRAVTRIAGLERHAVVGEIDARAGEIHLGHDTVDEGDEALGSRDGRGFRIDIRV
jgi:hypothetical protein